MNKWLIALLLLGVLFLGQVQNIAHYALDTTETLQPENLPPKH